MNLKTLFYPQKIFSTTSSFNQNIEVREFLGERSLRVNNVTQSGGIVEEIYKKILPVPSGINSTNGIQNILILGFGAGSFAKLVNKKYPVAKITGVEIDKEIIEVAKKYFSIDRINNLEIVTVDAFNFLKTNKQTFDLIFIDLYLGKKNAVPKVENKSFLDSLKKSLDQNGIVIFNLINFKKYQKANAEFLETLRMIFSAVTTKKAYSNAIVYCTL